MKYIIYPYNDAQIRKTWTCPICRRGNNKKAFEIELDAPDYITQNRERWAWVCSNKCANMYIFQNL